MRLPVPAVAHRGWPRALDTARVRLAWATAERGAQREQRSWSGTLAVNSAAPIPNDLAALAGKRLVVASETREGARLDEGRLKSITGGDRLKARFLNQEWFSFEPTFTLLLCMNHRPVIADDSYGFWRRVRLVPFECTFEPSPALADELRAEAPGVLRWAIEGCLAWRRSGRLTKPECVEQTTADYAADSDVLGEFLAEACEVDPDAEVRASLFFQHYRQWAEQQGLTRSAAKRTAGRLPPSTVW